MKVFNDLLVGADGKLKTFTAFRNDVAKTGALFNKTYLQTEYEFAVASAQMAQKWNEFADDDILEFRTVGDDKVSAEHALLDRLTAPKSDAIWRRIWPPLRWRCRCGVVNGVRSRVKTYNPAQLVKAADIPKQFQNNSGITKTVFDQDNIYYQNTFNQEKELSAEINYGMPSVKKLYANNDFPPAAVFVSKKEANNWWKEKAGGSLKGDIDVVDKMGTTLRFDNEFRKHVMEDNKDGRFAILENLEEIVSAPDEIWSIRENDSLVTTYIRYYDGLPYAVQAESTRPYTMFSYDKAGKLNESSLIRDRRGILLYRKN